jgi:predicted dehydrogenase
MKVGLIGTGRISDIYLTNCMKFDELDVIACASLDREEASLKAKRFNLPRVLSPDELLSDDEIECVLNLTIPAAHFDIANAALEAGKHVYSEKPFATSLNDAQQLLDLAAERQLLIGNAPDTFMGGRWQTVRRLIDSGVIGKPSGFTAHVGTHGVERHHPNPDFYYKEGGGPLLDLGPYYLTVLVFLFGPMTRVCGMSNRSTNTRLIENGPRHGEIIDVEIDTHSLSLIEFDCGVVGSMTMSFDVWDSESPRLEIYGSEGSICVPDLDPVHGANNFDGPVWFRRRADSRWEFQPRPTNRPEQWLVAENRHGYNANYRGLGLRDLAQASVENREPRANGKLAFHILEALIAIEESARNRTFQEISSTVKRPDPMPIDEGFVA